MGTKLIVHAVKPAELVGTRHGEGSSRRLCAGALVRPHVVDLICGSTDFFPDAEPLAFFTVAFVGSSGLNGLKFFAGYLDCNIYGFLCEYKL